MSIARISLPLPDDRALSSSFEYTQLRRAGRFGGVYFRDSSVTITSTVSLSAAVTSTEHPLRTVNWNDTARRYAPLGLGGGRTLTMNR